MGDFTTSVREFTTATAIAIAIAIVPTANHGPTTPCGHRSYQKQRHASRRPSPLPLSSSGQPPLSSSANPPPPRQVREMTDGGVGHKFLVKTAKERKSPGKHRGHVTIIHALLYRANTVIVSEGRVGNRIQAIVVGRALTSPPKSTRTTSAAVWKSG